MAIPPAPPGYGPSGYGAPAGPGAPWPPGTGSTPHPGVGYGHPQAPSPRQMLLTALTRARAASLCLFALIGGWLAFGIGGLLLLDATSSLQDGQVLAALDTSDNADVLFGLAILWLIGVGAAVWALMALWTSWTARAARSVGRAGEVGLSHIGWWGLFVPLGNIVLVPLAHHQAARFTASARQPQHQQQQPTGNVALLVVWWVAAAVALTCVLVAAGLSGDEASVLSEHAEAAGVLMVLASVVGTAASITGGIAMRTVHRQGRVVTDA